MRIYDVNNRDWYVVVKMTLQYGAYKGHVYMVYKGNLGMESINFLFASGDRYTMEYNDCDLQFTESNGTISAVLKNAKGEPCTVSGNANDFDRMVVGREIIGQLPSPQLTEAFIVEHLNKDNRSESNIILFKLLEKLKEKEKTELANLDDYEEEMFADADEAYLDGQSSGRIEAYRNMMRLIEACIEDKMN